MFRARDFRRHFGRSLVAVEVEVEVKYEVRPTGT